MCLRFVNRWLPILAVAAALPACVCLQGEPGSNTLANRSSIAPISAVASELPGVDADPSSSTCPGLKATVQPAKPVSLLQNNTLLTIYGRAFGVAPILGHLGTYTNFEMMARDVNDWTTQIRKNNDNKGVVCGVHLIYAMAIPCKPQGDCLFYLEGEVRDIVKDYIELAAQRSWVVILDTQLGRSNPVEQVRRMIDKGYLKHPNVHVAIDPEFHVYEGHHEPGIPIGTVEAAQINEVQKMLDDYVRSEQLPEKKILIVHQFGDANVNDGVPFMIQDKKALKTFANVDLVIDADGFGPQDVKVEKYNRMTNAKVYPFIRFRGIKVFFPNRWERAGHYDKPPLSIDQVFGKQKAQGGRRMATKPDVVIIA